MNLYEKSYWSKVVFNRANPRPKPLRRLPRAPLLEKGPKFTFFFSLLRRPKELSNARDRDKTNLNKLILQINVLLITSNSNRKMLKIL